MDVGDKHRLRFGFLDAIRPLFELRHVDAGSATKRCALFGDNLSGDDECLRYPGRESVPGFGEYRFCAFAIRERIAGSWGEELWVLLYNEQCDGSQSYRSFIGMKASEPLSSVLLVGTGKP